MSRVLVLILVGLVGGCSFQGVATTVDDSDAIDAAIGDAEPVAFYPGYRARRRVDIENSSRSALAGFPVFVRLREIDGVKIGALGEGLRFVADDHATELPFEIEIAAAPQIDAWVKVDLPAGADLRIWAYYDADTPTSASSAMDVFGDYEAVYHFADNFGVGDESEDSSGNGRHLDAVGLESTTDQDPVGAFGPAVTFDGGGDYFETAVAHATFAPALGGAMTYEVRFRSMNMNLATNNATVFDSTANLRGVSLKVEETPNGNTGTGEARGTFEYSDGAISQFSFAPSAVTGRIDDSSGRQYAYTIDLREAPHTHTLYVEGVDQGDVNLGIVGGIDVGVLRVGQDLATPNQPFRGVIDELRIGPLRSADWIAAVTANAAASMATIGAEQSD